MLIALYYIYPLLHSYNIFYHTPGTIRTNWMADILPIGKQQTLKNPVHMRINADCHFPVSECHHQICNLGYYRMASFPDLFFHQCYYIVYIIWMHCPTFLERWELFVRNEQCFAITSPHPSLMIFSMV
jgi:hypothetical protein